MSKKTDLAMYDLSSVFDLEEATAIRPGASILVTGPPMVGRDDLALAVLARGIENGEGAIAVTTDGSATDTIEELRGRTATFDGHRVAAIDCRADGGREEDTLDDGAVAHRVASPSDITGIGIGITKSIERLHDVGANKARLGLTSLSTMITYTNQQTVFKFCHVLSSRLDSAGFLGLFTIDSNAHDEQTIQVIKQAFDGIVELRESEGTREARIGGLQPQPSEWVEL